MVRLAFAEALDQSGRRDEARRALAVAHQRLLGARRRIEEPAWRHRFLHAVPVNARILALAEEWRDAAANALAPTPGPPPAIARPQSDAPPLALDSATAHRRRL